MYNHAAFWNIVLGIIVIATAVPLWLGKVPMNRWYGVRIEASYESDEAWYRINRAGGRAGTICGALILLVGILCVVYPPQSEQAQILILLLTPLLVIPMVIVAVLTAGKG